MTDKTEKEDIELAKDVLTVNNLGENHMHHVSRVVEDAVEHKQKKDLTP